MVQTDAVVVGKLTYGSKNRDKFAWGSKYDRPSCILVPHRCPRFLKLLDRTPRVAVL